MNCSDEDAATVSHAIHPNSCGLWFPAKQSTGFFGARGGRCLIAKPSEGIPCMARPVVHGVALNSWSRELYSRR